MENHGAQKFVQSVMNWTNESTTQIPGALTNKQVNFLQECGTYATAKGDIVEFGTWLGKSTVLLNTHLQDGETHWAYDRFIKECWMNHVLPDYKDGDSFYELYKSNTSECVRLNTIDGDICGHGWQGPTIRIMFLDALKTINVAKHVVRQWFPSLVPGSLVIDQDFMYCMTDYAYMNLYMYRLRNYLVPIVQADVLIAFRVVRDIPQEIIDDVLDDEYVTINEMGNMYRHWKDC